MRSSGTWKYVRMCSRIIPDTARYSMPGSLSYCLRSSALNSRYRETQRFAKRRAARISGDRCSVVYR